MGAIGAIGVAIIIGAAIGTATGTGTSDRNAPGRNPSSGSFGSPSGATAALLVRPRCGASMILPSRSRYLPTNFRNRS